MRVLVTGGAGFLGSHLCERLLAAGHEVVCLDNLYTGRRRNVARLLRHPAFELVRHDVVDPFVCEADQIYHLSCPASPVHYQKNPVRTIRIAVDGTRHALECAREVGAKILIASTSEVYGDPQEHPQRESYWGHVNPNGRRSCYDEGKRCAEALAVSYAHQYRVDVRIARIFNTYGPRMHEEDGRVVSNFICQALSGQPITIYGSGSQTRSFCYVSDTIDGILRLMKTPRSPGPVNLGNPEELEIRALAHLIREMTGSHSPLHQRALPENDPTRRRPDITKARNVLGWAPRVPVERGLSETIAYFRAVLGDSLPEAAASRGAAE